MARIEYDGTINISTEKDYKRYLRNLSKAHTPPCVYCSKDCGPYGDRTYCEEWLEWQERTEAGTIRKKMKSGRNG